MHCRRCSDLWHNNGYSFAGQEALPNRGRLNFLLITTFSIKRSFQMPRLLSLSSQIPKSIPGATESHSSIIYILSLFLHTQINLHFQTPRFFVEHSNPLIIPRQCKSRMKMFILVELFNFTFKYRYPRVDDQSRSINGRLRHKLIWK